VGARLLAAAAAAVAVAAVVGLTAGPGVSAGGLVVATAEVVAPVAAAESVEAVEAVDEAVVETREVFRITSDDIDESSSLVVSTAHPGLVYTANDGSEHVVYVLEATSGEVVGRTMLTDVDLVDLEAMAADGGVLVVADIGDNDADDPLVRVHRLAQPTAGDREAAADEVELTYVDGPHDAESVVYDAARDQVFVVTKGVFDSMVYASPQGVFGLERARLRPIAPGPGAATDAVLLPDRRHVVVRTYATAVVYSYPDWTPIGSFGLPDQEQGESIAALADGRTLWIGSEGSRSPVLAFTLPALEDLSSPPTALPRPTTTGTADPAPEASDTHRQQRFAKTVGWLAGAALLVVLGVIALLALRRSHHNQDDDAS
jgi:hypothetical protein